GENLAIHLAADPSLLLAQPALLLAELALLAAELAHLAAQLAHLPTHISLQAAQLSLHFGKLSLKAPKLFLGGVLALDGRQFLLHSFQLVEFFLHVGRGDFELLHLLAQRFLFPAKIFLLFPQRFLLLAERVHLILHWLQARQDRWVVNHVGLAIALEPEKVAMGLLARAFDLVARAVVP